MVLMTDKTVDILMDVCMVTMALAAFCVLISLTLDGMEALLDRLLKEIRERRCVTAQTKARRTGRYFKIEGDEI